MSKFSNKIKSLYNSQTFVMRFLSGLALINAGFMEVLLISGLAFILTGQTDFGEGKTMVIALVIVGIILSAFSLVGSVLVFVTINVKLIKPIQKISVEMENIAQGNMSSDFDLKPDESMIGKLTGSVLSAREYTKQMINELTHTLNEIANGNVSFDIEYDYRGEWNGAKTALQDILQTMNDDYSNIRSAAELVADASKQVAYGSQALSDGATEQASSLEELSSAFEEMAQNIRDSAANAKNASELSNIAATALEKGNREMGEMLEAMDRIEKKSAEIVNIIKTIENIAFQTNILALNAAVEAARAGEAGKGFAVVADEVRNLAGKSAQAAKSTTELIEDSNAAVAVGMKIVRETASTMNSGMEKSLQTNSLINEIAVMAERQASAIEQITYGVDQISAVVQANTATAEESAAASEEMSAQAMMLDEMLQKYKLRSDV